MKPTETAPAPALAMRMVDGFPVPVPPAGRSWLTTAEVAAAYETTTKRVYSWLAIGVTVGELGNRRRVLLRRIKMGGKAVRIYPDAVLAFLKETSAAPRDASAPAPLVGDGQRAAAHDAAHAELVAMGVIES